MISNLAQVQKQRKNEKLQEPNPQISFSKKESGGTSEKEYEVSLKRRTKKKTPRRKRIRDKYF